MKNIYETIGVSKEFTREELKAAYAKIFEISQAEDSNNGDINLNNISREISHIEVKSSLKEALNFLEGCLRSRRFIPIAIGEPGTKEEMIECLNRFGGWVGYNIADRGNALANISKVREICHS